FAKGVQSGAYKTQEVLLGSIQVMMQKARRGELGKKLTGMQYPPAFDHFCNVLVTISPKAYKLFCDFFGGRTIRSHQQIKAKGPQIQPGITAENIGRAVNILKSYEYHGPIILACDDTKLTASLRERRSPDGAWIVVGQTECDAIRVESQDEVDDLLKRTDLALGEKLRLWIIIVPVPHVPPIILAGKARGETDTGEDLLQMHDDLVALLSSHGVFPLAYAADGNETERKVQRLSAARGIDQPYIIDNPTAGARVSIPLVSIDGHRFVPVQDSKHGLKTARNQLLTGARTLVLGNFPLLYRRLLEIAQHPKSPLFNRDIFNVEKQNDRAAARVFSAEFLQHLTTHAPEERGLALYLFFLGGLFDAWQSRKMGHLQRVLLALRCRYFIAAWRAHIEANPDHKPSRNLISRESLNIFFTLCDTLIGLIVSYRDLHGDYPFLPWLHSTEPLEHVFGVLRQLMPDFTFADFLAFVPKLCAYLLGKFGLMAPEEQANLTAAGYWHTYNLSSDIDLEALAAWPSDDEIQRASAQALNEVQEAMSLVDIDARAMLARMVKRQRKARPTGSAPTRQAPPRNCASLMRVPAPLLNEYLNNDAIDSLTELFRTREQLRLQETSVDASMDANIAALAATNALMSSAL
ncbi:hypothetical protein EXIGLDRAFT_630566, partial [Exidia glandulosa HHB12029]